MSTYDEQAHPRATDGRFTTKDVAETPGGPNALTAAAEPNPFLNDLHAESGWTASDPYSGFAQDDREWERQVGVGGHLSGSCGPSGSGSCDGYTRSGAECACLCHNPMDESEFGAGRAADYHRWHGAQWDEHEDWWLRQCLAEIEED